MAHGHDQGAESLARIALTAAAQLSDDRAVLYSDLIFAALSEAAKAALEDLMAAGTYVFQSDFAKKHQATGRAEGRIEERAHAILDVLDARGFSVLDEIRARILTCTDPAQLAVWHRKAVTAATVDQVF